MSNYSVKAIKFSRGHDGDAMQCDLYNGKKKIAEVWDDSWGGEYQYTWVDKNEKEPFLSYVKSLGQVPNHTFSYDADIVVAELVDKVVAQKEEQNRKKKYKNCIVIGQKEKSGYAYYKLPRNIADYPIEVLQNIIKDIKKELKEDEFIANDNLPV